MVTSSTKEVADDDKYCPPVAVVRISAKLPNQFAISEYTLRLRGLQSPSEDRNNSPEGN